MSPGDLTDIVAAELVNAALCVSLLTRHGLRDWVWECNAAWELIALPILATVCYFVFKRARRLRWFDRCYMWWYSDR